MAALLPNGSNAERIGHRALNLVTTKFAATFEALRKMCKTVYQAFVNDDAATTHKLRDLAASLNNHKDYPLEEGKGWDETFLQFVFDKAQEDQKAKATAASDKTNSGPSKEAKLKKKLMDMDQQGTYWNSLSQACSVIPRCTEFNENGGFGGVEE